LLHRPSQYREAVIFQAEGSAGDTDGSNYTTRTITNWSSNALQPLFKLFVVNSETAFANLLQFSLQCGKLGDCVPSVTLQTPLTDNLVNFFFPEKC
jgi:hypothetical protein